MYFRWNFLSNNMFSNDLAQVCWGIFISLQIAMFLKTAVVISVHQLSVIVSFISMIGVGVVEATAATFILVPTYFIAEKMASSLWSPMPFLNHFFHVSLPETDLFTI